VRRNEDRRARSQVAEVSISFLEIEVAWIKLAAEPVEHLPVFLSAWDF
jgi:hypothetical protein